MMKIKASAKVNLYLAVIGKRSDGYHDIESLFVPIPDLCDELTICPDPGKGTSVTCNWPELPGDYDNLVWQAVERLSIRLGVAPDWHVELHKRIPLAAGLGGGSSDAAAVLKALPELCAVEIERDAVCEIARGLGADVAFFLQDRACVARGIGDELTPVKCGIRIPLLLINAGFPVSSAWAYEKITPEPRPGIAEARAALEAGDLQRLAQAADNAFETVVFDKFPILQLIAETVMAGGALCVRLSGSGPTLFAMLPDLEMGEEIKTALNDRFGDSLWMWSGLV